MDSGLIAQTAELLLQARHAVALTGAGISTESGVPDFRSPGGIWSRYDPRVFFLDHFLADPEDSWKTLLTMSTSADFPLLDAEPNAGHRVLSELEHRGQLQTVITQNIDNLHQKAGSRHVIEFHGNMLHARCLTCDRRYGYREVFSERIATLPPRCDCGGILKPDMVYFGESIPADALQNSFDEARRCDLMLVIGTSAQVEPAASLPRIARGMLRSPLGFGKKRRDPARVIEINRESTPLTGRISDFIIQGSAGDVLTAINDQLQEHKDRQ